MNHLLYVCWNKGERVRGSFSCLLDYADNLVKTPLRQLSLFFNGPVRCHTAESFLSVSFVAAGTVATRPGFLFSTVACRCFMECSWQSIISLFWDWEGGSGGTRLWWMMLRSFQLLTWETGPHCELSGEMPHKSMSIWSINIAAKVTCALLALSLGMSRLIHLLECWVHLLKWHHINDWKYRHKTTSLKKNVLTVDSHTSRSLRLFLGPVEFWTKCQHKHATMLVMAMLMFSRYNFDQVHHLSLAC